MKLEEARKLAENIPYHDARDPALCPECKEHLRRQNIRAQLRFHCYNHFDEVVKALEAVCRSEDTDDHWIEIEGAKQVLDKAKEVK